MNIIDIIILLCCVPAIFRGLSKGFIAQAAALVALVLGAWMSFHFSNVVVGWLEPVMDVSPTVLQAIAFTLILLAVFLALTLAGKMLEGIVKIVMLGWLNKLLGVVFALMKVILAIGLFILLFDSVTTALGINCSKTISGSVLYTPIKDFADAFFPYMKELIFNK
ncbi:MAG TPA: hypothetical protein DDX40_09745 [Rikenellaceae bacterium]|nr:hypothetical protein [Rikenellaceae bacterium]